ncbi:hypothetical protein FPQ18DRAFT_337030 [Pyronema domesticum]|nr:hypothetical protein FPQ18DRAFT_337030 [Pyronema domesticum]
MSSLSLQLMLLKMLSPPPTSLLHPPHRLRRSRSSSRPRFVPCPRSQCLGRSTRRLLSFPTQPSRSCRLLLRITPLQTTRRRMEICRPSENTEFRG